MLGDDTLSTLKLFGDSVVNKSKNNLRRKKKKASGGLHDSIGYDVKVSKNSFSLAFKMQDYWDYVDSGVKGAGGTKADGSSWKTKRVTNSKYKYKKKKPPIMAFNGWTIRKGIAPRSKGGQFTKRRGLLFAIATSVFHTGLETTSFFSKPFEKEFKELPDELVEAYALDVEEFLKFTIE
jgi:hypothetical protein